MASKINGFTVGYTVVGAIVLWSGIKGETLTSTFRDLISAKPPNTNQEPINTAFVNQDVSTSGTLTPPGPPGKAESSSAATNQAIAKILAGPYNWNTGANWNALVNLWERESGWSNTADTRKTGAGGDNASSTVFAYGIPQARPYSKMPKSAWPPDLGGSADPSAQIGWGLNYIFTTYGDPSNAWAHEESAGWY